MITVVNMKTHEPTGHDIYIGRGSPLGNPKPISHLTTREEALVYYEDHLARKLKEKDKPIRDELNRIHKAAKAGDVNLVCYCKPRDCHGDIIKRLIEGKL